MRLVGIDGCRGGWIVAESDDTLSDIEFGVEVSLADLFAKSTEDDAVVAIDMPIGLSPNGARRCDVEARRILGARGSSVFPVPCRCTLSAASYDRYREACDLNAAACGKRLSKQSHGILPKIAHVDALIQPSSQKYIRESHPEVALRIMNGGLPVHPKKSAEGQRQRLALLRRQGLSMGSRRIDQERRRLGVSNLGVDDLIDALVCLTIARRISGGQALRFPSTGDPDRDERGLLMEIWA